MRGITKCDQTKSAEYKDRGRNAGLREYLGTPLRTEFLGVVVERRGNSQNRKWEAMDTLEGDDLSRETSNSTSKS
jgi:hypothetical protein